MAKRIIINADDFGMSAAVNEAVAHASTDGILTSATVMANMPGFDEAVRIAKATPRLGVGVHLNLLRGAPLAPAADVDTLVGGDGRFLNSALSLVIRFLSGRVDLRHVEMELTAQIEKVIAAGLLPTHLDSEKHMHIIVPDLWEIVCRIATRYGIRCIRIGNESAMPRHPFLRSRFSQRVKARIVLRRSLGLSDIASRHGLRRTDRFFGVAMTGNMTTDTYRVVFSTMKDDSLEIMCHPALQPSDHHARSWLDGRREAEYRALIDPALKKEATARGIELITYREIR